MKNYDEFALSPPKARSSVGTAKMSHLWVQWMEWVGLKRSRGLWRNQTSMRRECRHRPGWRQLGRNWRRSLTICGLTVSRSLSFSRIFWMCASVVLSLMFVVGFDTFPLPHTRTSRTCKQGMMIDDEAVPATMISNAQQQEVVGTWSNRFRVIRKSLMLKHFLCQRTRRIVTINNRTRINTSLDRKRWSATV